MKYLKLIWQKWLKIAKIIGNFQSQLILSIFYIVIILPLGILYTFFLDELGLKTPRTKSKKTNFIKWDHEYQNLENSKKQY